MAVDVAVDVAAVAVAAGIAGIAIAIATALGTSGWRHSRRVTSAAPCAAVTTIANAGITVAVRIVPQVVTGAQNPVSMVISAANCQMVRSPREIAATRTELNPTVADPGHL